MDNNPAKIIHAYSSTFDRISSLPDNIIEFILSLMPLRDAARMSILSSSWRNKWRYIPELVFDNDFSESRSNEREVNRDNLIWFDIFLILLLHRGPITCFKLCIDELKTCPEVDQLFLFFYDKHVEEFVFYIDTTERFPLPSHVFSYDNLRKLSLSCCVFRPPTTFRGFHRVARLAFHEVFFKCEDFHKGFISLCPLLEHLTMVRCEGIPSFEIDFPNLKSLHWEDGHFTSFHFNKCPLLASVVIFLDGYVGEESSNCLVRFFECLPFVKTIHVNLAFLLHLITGGFQKRLPTDIQSLQAIELDDISLCDVKVVSCIMCLIMSCPNLKSLSIKEYHEDDPSYQFNEVFEYEYFSDYSSDELTRLEIEDYRGSLAELEFVKFLLTKLASLEVLFVKFLHAEESARQVVMLKDIVQLPRISPKAMIICVDPYEYPNGYELQY